MTKNNQVDAKTIADGMDLYLARNFVLAARVWLGFCLICFIWTAAENKVSETWKLGLPVTLLGLPGLANIKKLEDASR